MVRAPTQNQANEKGQSTTFRKKINLSQAQSLSHFIHHEVLKRESPNYVQGRSHRRMRETNKRAQLFT